MEFESDWVWLLLGLPLAFALGWLASRVDLRQLRLEDQRAPKAYFRGLNHLLNEQQDEAIDAFIEAVQKDPDTSELHFALGNLFRRRGEYERAVRVHEHLLQRADLNQNDRDRAQYALALDFLKAGLLDHAESSLKKLDGTRWQTQAWLALLNMHERARDWPEASELAKRLQGAQGINAGDFTNRLAHYQCEQAELEIRKNANRERAKTLLEQAIAASPLSARPRIQLAGLLADQHEYIDAFDQLAALQQNSPQTVALIASEWVRIAKACGRLDEVCSHLEHTDAQPPSVDIADALVKVHEAQGMPAKEAQAGYVAHMAQEPSLIAAARWLSHLPFADDSTRAIVQRSLDQAARPLARYRCAACGFETQGYFWQCPGCQTWESFPPRRIEEL